MSEKRSWSGTESMRKKGANRDRTGDLPRPRRALYQLSYRNLSARPRNLRGGRNVEHAPNMRTRTRRRTRTRSNVYAYAPENTRTRYLYYK